MAASAMGGAWRAINALYDGANAASTLRHWHSPRQVCVLFLGLVHPRVWTSSAFMNS